MGSLWEILSLNWESTEKNKLGTLDGLVMRKGKVGKYVNGERHISDHKASFFTNGLQFYKPFIMLMHSSAKIK